MNKPDKFRKDFENIIKENSVRKDSSRADIELILSDRKSILFFKKVIL